MTQTTQSLLQAIAGASYCPLKWGSKIPLSEGWLHAPMTWEEIESLPEPHGVGILLGHGNLLAIDIDNAAGLERFQRIFGCDPNETPTISWTSGKDFDGNWNPDTSDRIQLLFKLSDAQAQDLEGRKVFPDNSLDIRWRGAQSVLPSLSPHPVTGKPYRWHHSPDEWEVLKMPEVAWHFLLQELAAVKSSPQSPIPNPQTTRLPAKLVSEYGPCLAIWLLARLWDNSIAKHGQNLGQGKATFSLSEAAEALQRGESTIRRYLAVAKAKGLLRNFYTSGDRVTVFVSSLEKVARAAGIQSLGAVAQITLDDLKNLRIVATEASAQALQRSSYWAAKQEEQKRLKQQGNKLKPQLIEAEHLFNPTCGNLARVLGRSRGILYVSEGFVSYGASQNAIAQQRGTSTRTVQRHLSNQRTQPSPVRGYRSELGFCYKAQIAQRVRRGITPKLALLAGFEEDASRLIHGPHDRMFYLRTNVYYPDRELVRARYRRRALNDKASLSKEKNAPAPPRGGELIRFPDELELIPRNPEPEESFKAPATPQGNRRQK